MSKRKDGGPAFARPYSEHDDMGLTEVFHAQQGMSLRDYFAAHALPACVMAYANSPRIADTYLTPETLAEMTYNTADEMLKRRDK